MTVISRRGAWSAVAVTVGILVVAATFAAWLRPGMLLEFVTLLCS